MLISLAHIDHGIIFKNKAIQGKSLDGLLIVVNMFLTSFDATTLNTLCVDKNLKMHGLIQALSRTNHQDLWQHRVFPQPAKACGDVAE